MKFDVKNLEKEFEAPLLHAFYWSAAMGDLCCIKKMINKFRWSPFMKSYKGRTVLTGAIWYDETDIVNEILGYDYEGATPEDDKKIKSLINGIDKNKRNPMHYAFKAGNNKITTMLRKFGYSTKKRRDVDGLLPYQSTHHANTAYFEDPDRWTKEDPFGTDKSKSDLEKD